MWLGGYLLLFNPAKKTLVVAVRHPFPKIGKQSDKRRVEVDKQREAVFVNEVTPKSLFFRP